MHINSLVIGIGNDWRGDDAIGLVVVRQLLKEAEDKSKFAETSGDYLHLVDLWQGVERVIIVDAMQDHGKQAGDVVHIKYNLEDPPISGLRCSTHHDDLFMNLRLAAGLGELPAEVHIIGIVGASFDMGSMISPALADSSARVKVLIDNIEGGRSNHA